MKRRRILVTTDSELVNDESVELRDIHEQAAPHWRGISAPTVAAFGGVCQAAEKTRAIAGHG